ncbi:5'-Nucleotidase/apyrase [Ascosphaera apis ARSEF 7405]|uniref:5'-Nucleotidase/apyrase n=1 Tax=Ascosphaera apis ARSEF 7405 TaxID=392613 RepID=A0A167UWV3_9EURO|nr:5'-Nucleotidase/apyrase [Ascosphaera apis ARSEF 7405]
MIPPSLLATALAFLYTLPASAIQPTAPSPIPAPLRDLSLGQLNFLHTTDIHGWLSGHLREPSFAADWGDYISFTEHMRAQADAAGNDLLVIDTGDRVEGSGLYDMSNPPGKYYYDIFQRQSIDLLCVGNHELYKAATADAEYNRMAKYYNTSYISSNVDIYDAKYGQYVPLAQRFKKFTTKNQGIRIMAFGFLFNFLGNANNTIVHTVESTIQQSWFQSAIRDSEIDLIVVAGHIPVHSDEYTALYRAIRQVRGDLPIHFFGGHLHIRDYARYDDKAYGLASGRFMETVGFASISGLSSAYTPHIRSTTPISFHRRYIDNNLFSYYHHTNTNESTFPTEKGLATTQMITDARNQLELDHTHGCSPDDYWMSRAKYPQDNSSIYTWLSHSVFPATVRNESRKHMPSLVLTNTGSIRFDILKGPFTRDSAATFCPFTSVFKYVKDVPYEKALVILALLNDGSEILKTGIKSLPGKARQRPMGIPEEIGRAQDAIEIDDTINHAGGAQDE